MASLISGAIARVTEILSESVGILTLHNENCDRVLFHICDLYVNGKKCYPGRLLSKCVSVGRFVNCDAVKIELHIPYLATFVCVGCSPDFDAVFSEFVIEKHKMPVPKLYCIYRGIVVKLLFPSTALAMVSIDEVLVPTLIRVDYDIENFKSGKSEVPIMNSFACEDVVLVCFHSPHIIHGIHPFLLAHAVYKEKPVSTVIKPVVIFPPKPGSAMTQPVCLGHPFKEKLVPMKAKLVGNVAVTRSPSNVVLTEMTLHKSPECIDINVLPIIREKRNSQALLIYKNIYVHVPMHFNSWDVPSGHTDLESFSYLPLQERMMKQFKESPCFNSVIRIYTFFHDKEPPRRSWSLVPALLPSGEIDLVYVPELFLVGLKSPVNPHRCLLKIKHSREVISCSGHFVPGIVVYESPGRVIPFEFTQNEVFVNGKKLSPDCSLKHVSQSKRIEVIIEAIRDILKLTSVHVEIFPGYVKLHRGFAVIVNENQKKREQPEEISVSSVKGQNEKDEECNLTKKPVESWPSKEPVIHSRQVRDSHDNSNNKDNVLCARSSRDHRSLNHNISSERKTENLPEKVENISGELIEMLPGGIARMIGKISRRKRVNIILKWENLEGCTSVEVFQELVQKRTTLYADIERVKSEVILYHAIIAWRTMKKPASKLFHEMLTPSNIAEITPKLLPPVKTVDQLQQNAGTIDKYAGNTVQYSKNCEETQSNNIVDSSKDSHDNSNNKDNVLCARSSRDHRSLNHNISSERKTENLPEKVENISGKLIEMLPGGIAHMMGKISRRKRVNIVLKWENLEGCTSVEVFQELVQKRTTLYADIERVKSEVILYHAMIAWRTMKKPPSKLFHEILTQSNIAEITAKLLSPLKTVDQLQQNAGTVDKYTGNTVQYSKNCEETQSNNIVDSNKENKKLSVPFTYYSSRDHTFSLDSFRSILKNSKRSDFPARAENITGVLVEMVPGGIAYVVGKISRKKFVNVVVRWENLTGCKSANECKKLAQNRIRVYADVMLIRPQIILYYATSAWLEEKPVRTFSQRKLTDDDITEITTWILAALKINEDLEISTKGKTSFNATNNSSERKKSKDEPRSNEITDKTALSNSDMTKNPIGDEQCIINVDKEVKRPSSVDNNTLKQNLSEIKTGSLKNLASVMHMFSEETDSKENDKIKILNEIVIKDTSDYTAANDHMKEDKQEQFDNLFQASNAIKWNSPFREINNSIDCNKYKKELVEVNSSSFKNQISSVHNVSSEESDNSKIEGIRYSIDSVDKLTGTMSYSTKKMTRVEGKEQIIENKREVSSIHNNNCKEVFIEYNIELDRAISKVHVPSNNHTGNEEFTNNNEIQKLNWIVDNGSDSKSNTTKNFFWEEENVETWALDGIVDNDSENKSKATKKTVIEEESKEGDTEVSNPVDKKGPNDFNSESSRDFVTSMHNTNCIYSGTSSEKNEDLHTTVDIFDKHTGRVVSNTVQVPVSGEKSEEQILKDSGEVNNSKDECKKNDVNTGIENLVSTVHDLSSEERQGETVKVDRQEQNKDKKEVNELYKESTKGQFPSFNVCENAYELWIDDNMTDAKSATSATENMQLKRNKKKKWSKVEDFFSSEISLKSYKTYEAKVTHFDNPKALVATITLADQEFEVYVLNRFFTPARFTRTLYESEPLTSFVALGDRLYVRPKPRLPWNDHYKYEWFAMHAWIEDEDTDLEKSVSEENKQLEDEEEDGLEGILIAVYEQYGVIEDSGSKEEVVFFRENALLFQAPLASVDLNSIFKIGDTVRFSINNNTVQVWMGKSENITESTIQIFQFCKTNSVDDKTKIALMQALASQNPQPPQHLESPSRLTATSESRCDSSDVDTFFFETASDGGGDLHSDNSLYQSLSSTDVEDDETGCSHFLRHHRSLQSLSSVTESQLPKSNLYTERGIFIDEPRDQDTIQKCSLYSDDVSVQNDLVKSTEIDQDLVNATLALESIDANAQCSVLNADDISAQNGLLNPDDISAQNDLLNADISAQNDLLNADISAQNDLLNADEISAENCLLNADGISAQNGLLNADDISAQNGLLNADDISAQNGLLNGDISAQNGLIQNSAVGQGLASSLRRVLTPNQINEELLLETLEREMYHMLRRVSSRLTGNTDHVAGWMDTLCNCTTARSSQTISTGNVFSLKHYTGDL